MTVSSGSFELKVPYYGKQARCQQGTSSASQPFLMSQRAESLGLFLNRGLNVHILFSEDVVQDEESRHENGCNMDKMLPGEWSGDHSDVQPMHDFAKDTVTPVSVMRSMVSVQPDGSLAAPPSCRTEVKAQLASHIQEHFSGCWPLLPCSVGWGAGSEGLGAGKPLAGSPRQHNQGVCSNHSSVCTLTYVDASGGGGG